MAAMTSSSLGIHDTDSLLSSSLPDWNQRNDAAAAVVGILIGEGIGAEVVGAARGVLDRICANARRPIEIVVGGKIGRPAQAECGAALLHEVI